MGVDKVPSTVGLEHPLFGDCARQLFKLRSEDLHECLNEQRRRGGRLAEILQQHNLLTHDQVIETLTLQARWVAAARRGDLVAQTFPLPFFLSLCLPAYNEERNISAALDAACVILPEFVTRFEIIVVDDGSRDATAEIVTRYAERIPHVRLVQHPSNRGYGAAVTSGLQSAAGDLIAFTDAD